MELVSIYKAVGDAEKTDDRGKKMASAEGESVMTGKDTNGQEHALTKTSV